MKFLITLIITFLAIGCGGKSTADPSVAGGGKPASDRGNEIVEEYLKRDASPYRKDRVRFTIKEEGEKTEIFELDVFRRQANGVTTTLSIITKPEDDAGSGTLTVEEKGKPAVNVTYSVSRDEFRETDTGKMFFGGLTAQELLGEWNKYAYKFTGEVTSGGTAGLGVEGKLKDGEKSVVASNKIIFDAKDYVPLEVSLFDNTSKEIRTYKKGEIKSVNGRPYVASTNVVNHVYNSRITIEILSRELPEKLDDAIFTREKLKQSAKK